MSKCKVCNYDLGEMPMCFGANSPASQMVPEEEYESRVEENEDQCIIDGEHFFIRGHIELPIVGTREFLSGRYGFLSVNKASNI